MSFRGVKESEFTTKLGSIRKSVGFVYCRASYPWNFTLKKIEIDAETIAIFAFEWKPHFKENGRYEIKIKHFEDSKNLFSIDKH